MDKKLTKKELERKIIDLEEFVNTQKENETMLRREIDALRQTGNYYEILMQNTEDYILICDKEGVPQVFNDSYKKRIESLTGQKMKPGTRPPMKEYDPETARYWNSLQQRVLKGEKFIAEFSASVDDSERLYYETLFCPVREGNQISGFVEITRDITERKKVENALKDSVSFNSSLLENSPNAILVLNPDTSIRYVNPFFENLTGYTSEEIIGLKTPYPWWVNDPSYGTEEEKRKLFLIGIHRAERQYKKKNGEFSWVEINITPIYQNGEMSYSLATWVDISERKEAQRKSKELEEKLQRSQKMESLGLLAGGVAHDLNNVLAGIVSYPDLLLMDLPESSRLKKPILTIKESGDRAVAIVQDLLTIARGVATVKKPLNLNKLIDEYLESPEFGKLRQYHPAVDFSTDLDATLLNINGSQIHLRKVVMNLMSNAMEAIDGAGDVKISTVNCYLDRPLKAYDNVKPGEYVVLSVSDSGPGISPTDLDRIFEPFYSKKILGRSGTGLGLPVVWNVIQEQSGYINVTSDDSRTVFDLYFPISREKISDESVSFKIEDYTGNGEKILVIDDMQSQRDISRGMLEKLGYAVETAACGEEAVKYLETHTVDLLILDMIMDPGINGRQTYEKILETHPDQKALIVSGYAETDEVKATQDMGAGQFIKKPFTIGILGDAVKRELNKQPSPSVE